MRASSTTIGLETDVDEELNSKNKRERAEESPLMDPDIQKQR